MCNYIVLGAIANISIILLLMVGFIGPQARVLLCLLVFEIWIPFICLQPEIQIKLINHVLSTSQA
jgi:hypothetical protein